MANEMRRALSEDALKVARRKFGKLRISCAENGEKLVVIRPADPDAALALAKTALANQDKDLLDRIPEQGSYQWVGFLAIEANFAVDKEGQIVDGMLPGDSIVDASAVKTEKDMS